MTAFHMQEVLDQLVHGLMAYQRLYPGDSDFGGVFCTAHAAYHSRGGEAAFPLFFRGSQRGDPEMMEAGLYLADWLTARQNKDGSWYETPGDWKGTTVFQSMALAALADKSRDRFSAQRSHQFSDALSSAADWICRNVSFRTVTTNYVAAAAAALALTDRYLPNSRWRKAARRFARMAAHRINPDGLVEGEGRNRRILGKIVLYPRGIDIGYGLEMTLAALSLYISVSRDSSLAGKVLRAIESHLVFLYPDGTLDNSLGSRGYKWNLYGSKTAHGSQLALAFAAAANPACRRALELTLQSLEAYVAHGLIRDDARIAEPSGTTCIYPTVMRACSLALTLAYLPLPEARSGSGTLPAEASRWVKKIASLNSILVKSDGWMATMSGYDSTTAFHRQEGLRPFSVPGGGTVSYLYNRYWGTVQVASQIDYQAIEPLHVPGRKPPVACLTPRLVLSDGRQTFTSARGRPEHFDFNTDGDVVLVSIHGRFIESSGAARSIPSSYQMTCTFAPDRITKFYRIQGGQGYVVAELIEPVIIGPGTRTEKTAQGVVLSKNGCRLTIEGIGDAVLQAGEVIACPLPALRAMAAVWRFRNLDQQSLTFYLTLDVDPQLAIEDRT